MILYSIAHEFTCFSVFRVYHEVDILEEQDSKNPLRCCYGFPIETSSYQLQKTSIDGEFHRFHGFPWIGRLIELGELSEIGETTR